VTVAESRIRCSVGITACNEEANIGRLLEAMPIQLLDEVEIAEIIVVASECTDRTEEIVREHMAWTTKDPGCPAADCKAGQGGGQHG